MLLIKILSDFRQIVLVYAGCELRELTGGQWRANPMESKGRQNPKSKDSLKGRSVWSIQKLRSKAKARHVTFLTASLKKRAEGYSIAQEPSFSLGAKNTIRARNCLGCAGDTGILLLLCKISTRLAREIERRLVKSKNKKKSEKPELWPLAHEQPECCLQLVLNDWTEGSNCSCTNECVILSKGSKTMQDWCDGKGKKSTRERERFPWDSPMAFTVCQWGRLETLLNKYSVCIIVNTQTHTVYETHSIVRCHHSQSIKLHKVLNFKTNLLKIHSWSKSLWVTILVKILLLEGGKLVTQHFLRHCVESILYSSVLRVALGTVANPERTSSRSQLTNQETVIQQMGKTTKWIFSWC